MILDETFPGHLVLQIFLQPIVCVGFLRVSYSAKGSSACATAKKGPVLKAKEGREKKIMVPASRR